jgi:phosphoglycolate phosphatase-like HAD superfamily hydrolase
VLADALAALDIEAGRHVVLVGDRSHDVIGAHTVGIECVGVAWGYGTHDELVAAGADTVVMDVEELAVLLGVTLPRVTSPGKAGQAGQAGDEAGDEALA